jgi:hypothetical protein
MSAVFDKKPPDIELYRLVANGCFDAKRAICSVDDGFRITTHCVYPSNGRVEVTVRGGASTVVASDEGGALGEALAAGIPMRDFSKQLAHLVKNEGLLFKNGVIFTPKMPIEAAPLAVLLVANASQEIARWLYDHMKIKRSRDFKELLASFLKERFDERVSAATIIGHSNKPHKFANVISFPGGKRLIVDPVAHEASSINARVVANLDVRANKDPLIEQRIVYDDEEDWTPADLNLLQVGAFAIPFSRSSEVIVRLAADTQ